MEIMAVGLAAFGHGKPMLLHELLFRQRYHPPLGPFVQGLVLEKERLPALDARDLLALCEVPKLVRRNMQVCGRALQIHQLVAHAHNCSIIAF